MPPGRFLPAILGIALTHCFPPGDGLEPPEDAIYFPVGLAIDGASNSLFVANSDFDLQYNQGVLQRYDLVRLRELLRKPCLEDLDCSGQQRCDVEPTPDNSGMPSYFCVDRVGPHAGLPCGPLPEASATQRAIAPGRCAPINPSRPQDGGSSLVTSSVQIGAFATDAVLSARPQDAMEGPPGRLFIPVRGDTTLHYIDVDAAGNLDCGQARVSGGRCDDQHRIGDDPDAENTRDLRLPIEPFGIATTADGRVIAITHQTQGQVSLLLNDWSSLPPRLEFVVGGLPSRPMELAAVPIPGLVQATAVNYQPGFLVTFRTAPEVRLLRFFDDGLFGEAEASPARPYLADAGGARIATNSLGSDSRGIAIDDSDRVAAESSCSGSDEPARLECLREASSIPLDVYVSNRTPPSLVIGRTSPDTGATGSSDIPSFHRVIPLTAGPSRVFVGNIINRAGELETRVFVVCFDSRTIFIYDPEADRVEAEVYTGRGPHPLTFDLDHGVAYVGHFTDSYIGAIALDQRFPRSYGSIIATIGTPSAPRATK